MTNNPLIHSAVALTLQYALVLSGFGWEEGAAFGMAFFIGREHAQAEYRWIDAFGSGRRKNMPWWGGFDPRVWNKADAWLDWILPSVAVVSAALLACVL